MNKLNLVVKFMFALAALILAVSAMIYVVRPAPAAAVGSRESGSARGYMYTQSADGRTLYVWKFVNGQWRYKINRYAR